MRTTRRIIPFALLSGLLLSCGSEHRLARVRISQPGVREETTDTACKVPEQIAWTDDKGERHIVTRAEKDSVTGEEITSVELSEITVMARSKQVAERNGKINLDFVVTVPGELISNKWQLQLAPVAYKPSDTLYLDRIFLSGADFAKMQKRGYMRYQAFINSIIPDWDSACCYAGNCIHLPETFQYQTGNLNLYKITQRRIRKCFAVITVKGRFPSGSPCKGICRL